jgi:molybdopterin-containing oxidoreductase family membrane subunit
VPWGIYISAFAFFVGASAGATMVGLMIHAFERDDYKPIGTRAILISLLCIFAATLFIMADVGNPLRTLKVPWILRNPNSLFLLSSTSYYIFMALLLAELYYAIKIIRGKAGDKDKKIAKWLGIIAVPYALWVVHAFTGSIFGVIKSREYWNTPLVPAHFVSSALATGVAIVILVTILTSKITKRELVDRETLDHMGKLLAFFLVVTIFFDFFDSLVLSYSEIPEGIEAWRLLTGKYAPLFVLTIGGMFVALLILLFKQGRTIKGLSVASSLTLVAIAAYRYNLVIVGQLVPLLPGIPEIHYSPTGIEISVTVGIVALVMLLYTVLTKVLPMEETVSKEVV